MTNKSQPSIGSVRCITCSTFNVPGKPYIMGVKVHPNLLHFLVDFFSASIVIQCNSYRRITTHRVFCSQLSLSFSNFHPKFSSCENDSFQSFCFSIGSVEKLIGWVLNPLISTVVNLFTLLVCSIDCWRNLGLFFVWLLMRIYCWLRCYCKI